MLCTSVAYAVVRVRLPVTFVYSVEINKNVFNFFPPSGSQTILAFTKRHDFCLTVTLLAGASNAGGV